MNWILITVLMTVFVPKMAIAQGSLQGYMFVDYYSVLENNNQERTNMDSGSAGSTSPTTTSSVMRSK